MERFVQELNARLEAALAKIATERDTLRRYDLSIKEVQSAVTQLQTHLKANPFAGRTDEIRYFKDLAPAIYSQLFYYLKIYKFELYRPYSSPGILQGIYEQELKGIEQFYQEHEEFCRYHLMQATHCDDLYFTLAARPDWPVDEVSSILDTGFTLGAYWVSSIKANQRYRIWLEEKIAGYREGTPSKKLPVLPWEAGDTALVECAKAQHLAGTFGNVPFKRVIEWYEAHFDRKIYNYPNIEQEIARRKKSRTKYLDGLRETFNRKMDEDLEKD